MFKGQRPPTWPAPRLACTTTASESRAELAGSASCGRAPVYGVPTSAPIWLATWAGEPSLVYDTPDPVVCESTESDGA